MRVTGKPYGASAQFGARMIDGIARHVSAEGCQFILTGFAPDAGARLSFVVASSAFVSGTIRWVLGDRVGFAFDRPIAANTVEELARGPARFRSIRLLPSAAALASG